MAQHIGAIFADILEQAGIEFVFGMPGGCTPFLFDGLIEKQDRIRTVLVRHEGGAAAMADAHAKLARKPAVLMGQGPWIGSSGGYGILESHLSGTPMVIVADTSDYFSLPQHGPYQNSSGDFGSFDLPAAMRSWSKYTTVANNPSEFIHGLQLAIKHAVTGRPGPAAVLLKWSVAFAQVDLAAVQPRVHPLAGYLRVSPPCISARDAERIAAALLQARAPVMIAGQGVRSSAACDEVRELAELLGIPVATSFLGKSSLPETHDCAVGTMGAIGQWLANQKVVNADLILAVGTGLSPENTNWMSPEYIDPARQKIIQIDIEPLRAGWTCPLELGVTSDARLALQAVLAALRGQGVKVDARQRIEKLRQAKAAAKCFAEEILFADSEPIAPERVVRAVNEAIGTEDLLVLDGGNNRMWFSHHFRSKGAGQVLAGGGAAAVGYGPPAALSAKLTCPDRRVICVCGDGGMLMQLYALEMARDLNLRVTFVVLNNSCLGNVRDFQPPQRRIATEYSTPDFARIAEGFELRAFRTEKPGELQEHLQAALSADRAALVDVRVEDAPHFRLMTRAERE